MAEGPVRVASVGDAQDVAAIYAPYVLETAISFEEAPPSPDEMARRVAATLKTYPWLVFDEGEGPLGYAYASPHRDRAAYRWSVDVAVYVAAAGHGRGVGRALYGELLQILVRQGFHAAFAGIALPNPNSIRLHEAMGFVHLGTYLEVGFKHGEWRDVGWWRRPLAEGPPASEPTPFASMTAALPKSNTKSPSRQE